MNLLIHDVISIIIDIIIAELVVSFLLLTVSVVSLLTLYVQRGIREYAGMAMGLALLFPHITAEVALSVFLPVTPWNTGLATALISSGIALLIASFVVIYFSMKSLLGSRIQPSQMINLLLAVFLMGGSLRFVRAVPVEDSWGVVFKPMWSINILAFVVLSIVYRIIVLIIRALSGKERTKGGLLLLSGLFLLFISFVVAVIERQFSTTSLYFLLFYPAGLFLISLSIVVDPYIFIPYSHGTQLILITEKSGWRVVYSIVFSGEKQNEQTYTRALQGTFELLSALIDRDKYPRSITYLDNEILIFESINYLAFVITERKLPPVLVGISKVLDMLEEHPYLEADVVIRKELTYLFR